MPPLTPDAVVLVQHRLLINLTTYVILEHKQGLYMSDGIYILKTADGFRVTFSKRYDDFVTIEGKLAGLSVNECFGSCEPLRTQENAMDEALRISKKYHETDDGICLIEIGENQTFDEIVRN